MTARSLVDVRVAVGSGVVPAWQGECIAALRALDGVRLRVVAVPAPPWSPPRAFEAKLAGGALSPTTVAIDDRGEIDALMGAELVLDLTRTLDRLEGGGELWRFRIGERSIGRLPFRREIAAGRDTVDVALMRRGPEGDTTIRGGRFAVTPWYASTLRLALSQAARWPATVAATRRDHIELDGVPAAARADAAEHPFEGVRFAAQLARRFGRAVFDHLFEVTEWNVGFAPGSAREVVAGASLDVRWLPSPPPLTYVADPFVVERDGMRVLFVEQFDYTRNRGIIEALVLDEHDAIVRRHSAIDLPTHVSYPFPLEIDGELYLVPENCAGNEVALYRCAEFPGRWVREAALFADLDGVDTTLFTHEGRWWAFCTGYRGGSMLALNAFHASVPRGPWTAHAANPIVVDVAAARPAGAVFRVADTLYRPGQDCSRTYGGALTIARIDELSPQRYRETYVRHIDARGFGRYRDGTHTIGFTADGIVVDGKRVTYDVRKLAWVAKKACSRIDRILTRSTGKLRDRAVKT